MLQTTSTTLDKVPKLRTWSEFNLMASVLENRLPGMWHVQELHVAVLEDRTETLGRLADGQ
eukprot:305378-Amphidinium_carterae.1